MPMQLHEPSPFTQDSIPTGSGTRPASLLQRPRREFTADYAITHLLVATRLDPHEREAVRFAFRLAAAHRARVTLLHVAAPEDSDSAHWLDGIERLHHVLSGQKNPALTVVDNVRADLTTFLDREIPRDLRESLDVEVECRIGDVATEIAKYADSQDVDLIVLCDRPSAWRLPFFPGVSQQIVQLSSKPIVFAH